MRPKNKHLRTIPLISVFLLLGLAPFRPLSHAASGSVWEEAGTGLAALAQFRSQSGPAGDEVERKIMAEIKERSQLMDNLEYLADVIGPRLTGTAKMKRANEWTLQRFKDYGLENAHLETWTIGNAWERVTARGRIVEPTEHPLTIAAMGWTPSTNGAIRGPVVYVKAQRAEDLEAYKGKLKGAIVLTSEPRRRPDTPAAGPAPAGPPAQPFDQRRLEEFRRFGRERDQFFKNEGVAAILRDSSKDHGLLNMGGSGGRDYQIAALPSAMITSEGYGLLYRLLNRGRVEVELEIRNAVRPGPIEVFNTVAEIRGSEKPDEVVLLGAHLDSWDLGTGTTDNATGSSVVLEAARALKALDLKPKRTIRFILFSGEEQGLVGSREYVKAHKGELDRFSAILVHDTGTGRVNSIGLSGNYQLRETMDQVVAPLRMVGLQELSMRRMGGTDHTSFDEAGVPGFYCIQDPAEYSKTHHSQSDTFDKAKKDNLVQGAQVVAVWAYRVSQLPELLPRRPKSAGAPSSGNE